MKVLVVEDDANKRNRLVSFYAEEFPNDHLVLADSLVSGLRALREEAPALVLLDMTLPNYSDAGASGFNPMRAFGGREFLRQASRTPIKTKVIVISQFETFGVPPDTVTLETLDAEFKRLYPKMYAEALYYHASRSSWQHRLKDLREQMNEGDN